MLASKQNEHSIGKHGKALERLLGKRVQFPLLDSFQNKSYGRNDRCTGDCFKVDIWASDILRTLSLLFLRVSENVQVKALRMLASTLLSVKK